jgi:hypothetical protein
MASMYGSVVGGDAYFTTRLHSEAWDLSSAVDKAKALYTATRSIDRLNFKGNKTPAYNLYLAVTDPNDVTDDDIRIANLTQELEFPRDGDTTVPIEIEQACYEIAFSLLDGVDPEMEIENLGLTSTSFAGVKNSFDRLSAPIEHLSNGIASSLAWRMLKPYLTFSRIVKISRV